MLGELCHLNDYEHTYFRRLVDILPVAAILGFRMGRKAPEDWGPAETKTIFLQQILQIREELDFLLQMMVMLEAKEPREEAVRRAFGGPRTQEEAKQWQEMFDSYVRGGVEELHERLVVRRADCDDLFRDDRTANLMALYQRFGIDNPQPKE